MSARHIRCTFRLLLLLLPASKMLPHCLFAEFAFFSTITLLHPTPLAHLLLAIWGSAPLCVCTPPTPRLCNILGHVPFASVAAAAAASLLRPLTYYH